MQQEYTPTLQSERLYVPTIIGAVTDYTPLHKLLSSPLFKFYISHTMNEFNRTEIHSNSVMEYITHSQKYGLLTVDGKVKYNKEYLGISLRVPVFNNTTGVEEFLFDILYELKRHLKKAIYDLSPFKEDIDIMYNNLLENMHSTNFNGAHHEYFSKELEQMDTTANEELERLIMDMAEAKNGCYGNGNWDTRNKELKGEEMPIEMDDTIEIMGKIKDAIKLSEELKVPEKTAEEIEAEEEAEYQRIDVMIRNGANTLRLNRKTIFNLPKSISNKFVLPLEASKKDDIDKFMHLTKQPFSFLNYNDSMFSVNLNTGLHTMWDEDKDESAWNSLAQESHRALNSVATRIVSKINKINERRIKLNKANNTLDEQVIYLKEQFEHKASKFKHSTYVKFIATRTANNITTIREAQNYSKRVEKALKNKRLIKDPNAFFNRALKLYLGKSGEDIIQDLETLKYTSRSDAEHGIKYLLFLLKLVEKREDDLIAPIITITDIADLGVGFEISEMVKVMAGHMFVHTVTIHKEYDTPKAPTPPPTRKVQEFLDKGMSIDDIQYQYPEFFI